MSWLLFHTQRDTADLWMSELRQLRALHRGPARAAWRLSESDEGLWLAGYLIQKAAWGPALELREQFRHARREAEEGAEHADAALRELIKNLRLHIDFRGISFSVLGQMLYISDLELNTALLAGSDAIRLAAKIDAWCADHCWIDGPDRAWAAGIIEASLDAGLYRRTVPVIGGSCDPGWSKIAELLRSDDTGPAVLSHSKGPWFPSAETHLDCPTEGRRLDAWMARWRDLPATEQWTAAVAWLREKRPTLRLSPDNLATMTAGLPVTVYDLVSSDREDRVRAAVRALSETAPSEEERREWWPPRHPFTAVCGWPSWDRPSWDDFQQESVGLT